MKMYPNPEKWAERIKTVPIPLRKKALAELDAEYERRGFKARGNGQDENGNFIEVAIKPGTSMEELYNFLDSTDTCAVTIDPADMPALYGKDILSLGMQRNLETHGPRATGLELLEPENVVEALGNARIQSFTGGNGEAPSELEEASITADLIANGHLDINEAMAVDRWLEAPEENSEPGNDMGEYAPDPLLEDWEAGL